MSTIVRAVPSLSNAPVTVRLIVVPIEAASALRNDPTLKFDETTFEAAAAVDAATFEAVVTPAPLDVAAPPVEGAEMLGIEGTEVVTVGVLIEGTLTVGVEIFPTFGKNGIAL